MFPKISVSPSTPLIDDVLVICISGLEARQLITVHAITTVETGVTVSSRASFFANQNGEIDISRDPSINGSYTGVDPMGLFWSMSHDPRWKNIRFMKQDVTTPLVTQLRVFDGEINLLNVQQHEKTKALLSSEIHRWYKAPGVQRVRLTQGILRGTLFIPTGKGPFPAAIDMFGGIGGCIEIRAALLASRGLLALALPFMDFKELTMEIFFDPKLTYFKEAVKWLSVHPLANPGGIGVVGVSFGGLLANFLAIKFKEIKALSLLISLHTFR